MPELICLDTLDDISVCGDADLLVSALRRCASDLLNNIARMAAIVRRLDELGVDVEVNHDLLPYIRLIASGKLSAACFVACAGETHLLEQALRLPVAVQERIAANEPLPVVNGDGTTKHVPALELTKKDTPLVFAKDHVRDEDEQREWMRGSPKKPAYRDNPSRDSRPRTPHTIGAEAAEPKPAGSAVHVELNWAAKKLVAAAVEWRKAVRSQSGKVQEEARVKLIEAVDDYLEVNGAAA